MFGSPRRFWLLTWALAVAFLGAVVLAACGGGGGPECCFPSTTIAGLAGQSGIANGVGAMARFNRPSGLTVDSSGNIYVGDTFNQTIRRITVAGGVGTVSTFAGTAGQSGSRNDTGLAATFNFPQGIVADRSGNLYVADTFNQTIRLISPAAAVTTFAGTPGHIGVTDPQGNALFSTPRGVTVDGSGNVYVADTGNNIIRKITPQRVVTIFAGTAGIAGDTDGPADSARFNNPGAIAIDGSGNLYVADTFNHTIREITPAGNVQTLAGTAAQSGSQDGTGRAARFNYPAGIAVDASGNIYVADTSNHTIRKITPAGAVTTIAGKPGVSGTDDDPHGNGSAARFNFPEGLALDRSGHLYVSDTLNFTIRQITVQMGVGGNPDGGTVALCGPMAVQLTSVAGYNSDVYSWYDANCRPRSAALVRNDARDPGGSTGGYLRLFSYEADGQTRQCVGQAEAGWNGWGYVVNRYGSPSIAATSHDVAGTYRTVLSGTYHAIHEFKVRVSPGGPVDTTIHWFFATGRSNPVYAITQDASDAGMGRVNADARSPYGSLTFDGMSTGNVTGIGWGEVYQFVTTGPGPLTINSPWDYSQTNVVPHVLMWSSAVDAEMGAVQTQTYDEHDSGAYYDFILQAACWHRDSGTATDCPRQDGGTLPLYALWPFELNQYEPPAITVSKRLGWGMSNGAVGQSRYPTLDGGLAAGYPYQSYSVFLVLGKRSDRPTDAQIAQVDALRGARVTATVGTVVTSGPGGVGRTDLVTYVPPGFDPVYAVSVVAAATGPSAGRATFQLNPGGRTLINPVFRIEGWTSTGPPNEVTLSGEELTSGVDYFATADPTRRALWLTLSRSVSSPKEIAIRP